MIELFGSPLIMPAEELPHIISVKIINLEGNHFDYYDMTNLFYDDKSDLGRYADRMTTLLDSNLSGGLDPRCRLYMDGKPVSSLRERYDFLLTVIEWFAQTYGLQVRNTYPDLTEVEIEDDPMARILREEE